MNTSDLSSSDRQARKTARHDLATGLAILALAGFLFIESLDIPVDLEDAGLSARFFPQAICGLMAVLGAILAFNGARGQSAPDDKTTFDGKIFISKVLPLSVLSFAYVWLFQLFGYTTATLITVYIGSYLFGVRGKAFLLLSPIMSLLFYYLFFGLMGVFEPPAEIFDVMVYLKNL
ncbi:tripartite tricarboxylate transporter TctB family protein [Pontibacterium sp. N1Y112]|uniref:Tripartite tricarboxylate transporter TctB family protein n=1 Tax=Pontibacterium sinense TaxID=2781979 RepID=A0A8J7FMD4_9GAMM|nr:tripartite tricarboxylate transporter TctB family protein [Pontibacterium sinense]MBE9398953.1 tripartite tricarboxylate transporter TctB family protein [Pontibacterium sinense]